MTVRLGIDILLEEKIDLLKDQRVGLLAHAASVDSSLHSTVSLFHRHPEIDLTFLMGPEHGLFGVAQDMEEVADVKDSETGLKVHSLYGNDFDSLRPKKEWFDQFDVLVIDLQDVGTRYYTYIYTMVLCMQACANHGKSVVILDRPNPLNGNTIEGNLLDPAFKSFVGLYSLPVRHGLTIAEMAQYLNVKEKFDTDLTLITMQGWRRDLFFDQTGLNWVPPSPNMPTLNTALVYPGQCLLEATEVSEARGTTMPFEWIGAPYIKAEVLRAALNKLELAGVSFRAIHFKPGYQKCAGQLCQGVQLHVTDRWAYEPFKVGLKIIQTLVKLYPKDFKWRAKPYEFIKDIPAIDLLTGSDDFRTLLEHKSSLADWMESFDEDTERFRQMRKPFLLY